MQHLDRAHLGGALTRTGSRAGTQVAPNRDPSTPMTAGPAPRVRTVSEPPISSPYRSAPGEPVDDDRRATLGRRLNEAYAAGTLDDLDYRQRLDTLYAARTLGELLPVVTGLPAVDDNPTPALVEQTGRPGEVAPTRPADPRRTLILLAAIVAAVVVVLAVVVGGLLT